MLNVDLMIVAMTLNAQLHIDGRTDLAADLADSMKDVAPGSIEIFTTLTGFTTRHPEYAETVKNALA